MVVKIKDFYGSKNEFYDCVNHFSILLIKTGCDKTPAWSEFLIYTIS